MIQIEALYGSHFTVDEQPDKIATCCTGNYVSMKYPSESNTNAEVSSNDYGTSRFEMPHATSGEKNGPSTDSSDRSSNPLAPLLPYSSYDPAIPDKEPPPYSPLVAQDSNDWKNRSGSFSPHINGGKLTSDLDNQAQYPTGSCLTERVPAMPMPMPASIKTEIPIGFTEAVTSEPKSANLGLTVGGHGSTMTYTDDNPMNSSSEFINSTMSGEYSKFSPSRQQQPDQRAQQGTNFPAQEEMSFSTCCLCCCEFLECWVEVFLETFTLCDN